MTKQSTKQALTPNKIETPSEFIAGKVEKAKDDAAAAAAGHNSNLVIPELVDMMTEDLALDEKKKEITRAQTDIRNRAKTQFGILKATWQREKQLRKMDQEVRAQLEINHAELKGMLGYQETLQFDTTKKEDKDLDPSKAATALIRRN